MSPSAPAAPLPPGARCGVHPVRRAVDLCPVCGRPRCAADAGAWPDGGCPACQGGPDGAAAPTRTPASSAEHLVRGALAAHAVAVLSGSVASQYVEAPLFSYLTPFVIGVLTAAAAQAAAGAPRSGASAMRLRVVAVVYALLGVALGFVIEESTDVLAGDTLLPYAAAVAGVVLWTLPPKPPRPAEE